MSVESLWLDVRYTLRTLGRSRGFTTAALLILALGIGATTAIFTVVRTVLWHQLPFADGDRVVWVVERTTDGAGASEYLPPLDARDVAQFREEVSTLSHVGVYASMGATVTTRGTDARRVRLAQVSSDVFPIVKARPVAGRLLQPNDEDRGAAPVAIISTALSNRRFGGATDAVGQSIEVDGRPYAVIGVVPPSMQFPESQTEVWTTNRATAGRPRVRRIRPIARVADGVPIESASAEVAVVLQYLNGLPIDPSAGSGPRARFGVVPVADEAAAAVRPALEVLPVAVALVLVLACINVAGLIMARTTARRGELAVREALGASRGRLVRQMLTENVVLTAGGGLIGVVVAAGIVELVQVVGDIAPLGRFATGVVIPRLDELTLDLGALVFAVVVSGVTSVLCGVGPAVSPQVAPNVGLRAGAAATSSAHRQIGAALVTTQIALATVLLVGGVLMVSSFVNLSSVDPGFDCDQVLTFDAVLPWAARRTNNGPLAEALVERLARHPAVVSVGYGQLPFLRDRTRGRSVLAPPSAPGAAWSPDAEPPSFQQFATGGYLSTLGIRLVDGRGFSPVPRDGPPHEVLVNEAFVRSGFAAAPVVGRLLETTMDAPFEVVGVLSDVRQFGLDVEPVPEIFRDRRVMTFWLPGSVPSFAIRTSVSPVSLVPEVRRLVSQIDPRAVVDRVATLDQIVAGSIVGPRLYAVTLGGFALVAVLLAAVGLYGLVAFVTERRTPEVGIRIALGAERLSVVGLAVKQGAIATGVGLAVGLAGAALLSRYLDATLFGVTSLDPTVYAAAAIGFLGVAAAAAFVPARRAARVDPAVALRVD